MALVGIFWARWDGSVYSDDDKVILRDRCISNGVESVVKELTKEKWKILWMLFLVIPLAGLIASYSENFRNSIGKAVHLTSAILFAWSLVQLPVYFLSILFARISCKIFLMSLVKFGKKPVISELHFVDGKKSELLLRHSYTLRGLDDAIYSLKETFQGSSKGQFNAASLCQMCIDLLIQNKSRLLSDEVSHARLAMGFLTKLVESNPDYGDEVQIQIQSDGSVVGFNIREGTRGAIQTLGEKTICRQ
jgi:hypothetical protein